MKPKGSSKKNHVSNVDKLDRKNTRATKKDRSSKRKLSIYDEFDDENFDNFPLEDGQFDES